MSMQFSVCVCVSVSVIPRGFLAAVVVAVRVGAVVRVDVAVLLAAVVAVPFLVVVVVAPVRAGGAVLAFGTGGRFSVAVCEDREIKKIKHERLAT